MRQAQSCGSPAGAVGDTCWAGAAPGALPSQGDPQHPAGFPEMRVPGKSAPSGQPGQGIIPPEVQDGKAPAAQPKSPSFPTTPPPLAPGRKPRLPTSARVLPDSEQTPLLVPFPTHVPVGAAQDDALPRDALLFPGRCGLGAAPRPHCSVV